MAFIKYQSDFYSLDGGSATSRYQINIWKKTGAGGAGYPIDFKCTSEGFVLSMDGSDDTMLAPIKTTSAEFSFVLEDGNNDQAEIIDDILAVSGDNEGELALEIKRESSGVWRRYWIGVILGDLGSKDDVSPTNFIKIKAIDGLAQLKYKRLKDSQEGVRSCLYFIKAALMEITSSFDDFGFWSTDSTSTRAFLTHLAFYYNQGMGNISSSTWRDDLDHDPLALAKISSYVFKDKNGQNWTYYKILENILAAFQLRIMMTPMKDGSFTGGNTFYSGNCTWLLQAPLVFHGSGDDSNLDSGTQRYFIHTKQLTTDVAIAEEDINTTTYYTNNPGLGGRILAGAKETFIPPLLKYKSIYNHKNFLGCALGPIEIKSNWDDMTSVNGLVNDNVYNGFSCVSTIDNNYAHYPLTKITSDEPPGWTGDGEKSSGQRLVITGLCEITPKMRSYVLSGQEVGYDSAGDCFDYYGGSPMEDSWGNDWYGIEENYMVMPRLALRLLVWVRDDNGNTTINGQLYDTKAYWLLDVRFCRLVGSTVWSKVVGNAFPTSGSDGMSADEDWNYPNNVYGYDGSWSGIQYWPQYPATTTWISSGEQQWGQDSGYSEMKWWSTTATSADTQSPLDCRFAYFSPVYVRPQVTYLNGCNAWYCDEPGQWVEWSPTNATPWGYDCLDYRYVESFVIESPNIPVAFNSDGVYSDNMIRSIWLFGNLHVDDCTKPDGTHERAAAKDWNATVLDTGGSTSGGYGCEARGMMWDYYISDMRVNIAGVNAGVNSFDETVGCYENTNGTPSEEMVQEPEIVIGSNPPEDPYAWSEESGTTGFGGDYPGQFRIYTQADDIGNPESGTTAGVNSINEWRALWEVTAGTAGNQLFHQRPKNALAHYYQIKRGLEFTVMDRTPLKLIERRLASGLYPMTGEWSSNQSGANVAFLVNGFKYVAGTGKLTMTLEDCVTFNRSNLVDKTYSSNG